MKKKIIAIIPAAGSGLRMGLNKKKQYLEINGKPLLFYTVRKFYSLDYIDKIIIVADRENIDFVSKSIILENNFQNKVIVICGGNTRTQSVNFGLNAVDLDTDIVLIHDGVRPFVSSEIIRKVIDKTIDKGAAIVCTKTVDTIKCVRNKIIQKTVDRKMLYNAQTPQGFEYKLIKECMGKAMKTDILFTDESSILEYFGYEVHMVESKEINIKITNKQDFEYAEYLASKRGIL
jgi:2-C-methyl-D-erythritol 4-phosphate cytidylyltransferase